MEPENELALLRAFVDWLYDQRQWWIAEREDPDFDMFLRLQPVELSREEIVAQFLSEPRS